VLGSASVARTSETGAAMVSVSEPATSSATGADVLWSTMSEPDEVRKRNAERCFGVATLLVIDLGREIDDANG